MQQKDKDIFARFRKLSRTRQIVITCVAVWVATSVIGAILVDTDHPPQVAVKTEVQAPVPQTTSLDNGYSDADRAAAMARIQGHLNNSSEKRFRCEQFRLQCN